MAANNNNNNDGSSSNSYTVCQEAPIAITDLQLLCDSPGAYYYGSGKYRNAATCQAGDKAKLSVQLEILDALDVVVSDDATDDDDSQSTAAYLTVAVTGYGSVSGVSLYENEDLCDYVVSKTKNVVCPEPGNYTLYDRFYWGNQADTDGYTYSFRPQVTLGLSSTPNKNQYDLGGANTNQCADGKTFVQWITTDVRMSMANTFKSFIVTFGLLTGTLCAVGLTAWWVVRQARRLQNQKQQLHNGRLHKGNCIIVDEEVDATTPYTALPARGVQQV